MVGSDPFGAGRANGLGRVDGLGHFCLPKCPGSVLGSVAIASHSVEACQRLLTCLGGKPLGVLGVSSVGSGALSTVYSAIIRAAAIDFLAAS